MSIDDVAQHILGRDLNHLADIFGRLQIDGQVLLYAKFFNSYEFLFKLPSKSREIFATPHPPP